MLGLIDRLCRSQYWTLGRRISPSEEVRRIALCLTVASLGSERLLGEDARTSISAGRTCLVAIPTITPSRMC